MKRCEQRQTAAGDLSIEGGTAQAPREAEYRSNDLRLTTLTIISACHLIRIAYYIASVNRVLVLTGQNGKRPMQQRVTAILPCNDIEAAQRFFERLGFTRDAGSPDDYRMLSDGLGGNIHLNPAVEGWLTPGTNPFGIYIYRENVDALAAVFASEIIEREGVSDKPWGMYEFAVNGPDETMVRIGWPTRLRRDS
jgi:hypothetical protein